jgi:hypothetical protein
MTISVGLPVSCGSSRRSLAARRSPLATLLTICLTMAWALADFSPPAILGNNDGLVERFVEQGGQVLGAAWPAFRIAGSALPEPGVTRRLAVAHGVITLFVRRHCRPPPRARGRQSCGRSPHVARCRLPAADNCVDIGRVELDAVAAPTGALGRDHRRAAAEKAIEHDVAAGRAAEDRIGDHRNRFDGRVQRQQIAFLAAAGKGIGSGIIPDIAAVAAELAELDMLRCPWRSYLKTKMSSCWLR